MQLIYELPALLVWENSLEKIIAYKEGKLTFYPVVSCLNVLLDAHLAPPQFVMSEYLRRK